MVDVGRLAGASCWQWRSRFRPSRGVRLLLLALTVPLPAERGPSEAQARPGATPAAETFTYDHENRLTQAVIGGVPFLIGV